MKKKYHNKLNKIKQGGPIFFFVPGADPILHAWKWLQYVHFAFGILEENLMQHIREAVPLKKRVWEH
jgi:hypothetical protein